MFNGNLEEFHRWLNEEVKAPEAAKREAFAQSGREEAESVEHRAQSGIAKKPQRGILSEAASALGAGVVSTGESIAGVGEMVGIPGAGAVREYLSEVGESEALRRPDYLAEGTVLSHPERLADWRWWVRSLGENIPNMAAMILPGLGALKVGQAVVKGVGVAKGLATVGKAGLELTSAGSKFINGVALAGAWSGAATIEAGAAYTQAKQEMDEQGYADDVIERVATAEGVAVGMANGILEILPFGNLFLRKTAAPIIRRIARQAVLEGSTEMGQETVNIAMEQWGHAPDANLKDTIGRIFESGIIGGVLGGGAGSVFKAAELDRKDKVESDQPVSTTGGATTEIGLRDIRKASDERIEKTQKKETAKAQAPSVLAKIVEEEEESRREGSEVREQGSEEVESEDQEKGRVARVLGEEEPAYGETAAPGGTLPGREPGEREAETGGGSKGSKEELDRINRIDRISKVKSQEQTRLTGSEGQNKEKTGADKEIQVAVETREKVEEAAAQVDTQPTEAQKEAGNYKKGPLSLHGLDISIENPKGSVRKGVSKAGKAWETTMQAHYGYIKRTEGKDGDHVDVFIGPKPESEEVYVVDQVNPETGKFDEHKAMLGFETIEEAKAGYLANYEKGWKGLGEILPVTMKGFKQWLKYGNTTKPITAGFKEKKEESLAKTPSRKGVESIAGKKAEDRGQRSGVRGQESEDRREEKEKGFPPKDSKAANLPAGWTLTQTDGGWVGESPVEKEGKLVWTFDKNGDLLEQYPVKVMGKPSPQPEAKGKEAWEMGAEEFWREGAGGRAFEGRGTSDFNHKQAVQQAISEGKITSHPDYPELTAKPPAKAAAEVKGKESFSRGAAVKALKKAGVTETEGAEFEIFTHNPTEAKPFIFKAVIRRSTPFKTVAGYGNTEMEARSDAIAEFKRTEKPEEPKPKAEEKKAAEATAEDLLAEWDKQVKEGEREEEGRTDQADLSDQTKEKRKEAPGSRGVESITGKKEEPEVKWKKAKIIPTRAGVVAVPIEEKPKAAEKAKETVDHIKNAVDKFKEINEILGKTGLAGPGPQVDQAKYDMIRPLLKAAWDEIVAAGKSAKEFVQLAIQNLSPKGRPYFEKFVREEIRQGSEGREQRAEVRGQGPEAREQKAEKKVLFAKGEKVIFKNWTGSDLTGTVTRDFYDGEPNQVPVKYNGKTYHPSPKDVRSEKRRAESEEQRARKSEEQRAETPTVTTEEKPAPKPEKIEEKSLIVTEDGKFRLAEKADNPVTKQQEEALLQMNFLNKTPAPVKGEQAVLDFALGPPGAGKTTFVTGTKYDNDVTIDPDKTSWQARRSGNDRTVFNDEAERITDAVYDKAMEGRYDVLWDGMGSTYTTLEAAIEKGLSQGRSIEVNFIYVDLVTSRVRSLARYHEQLQGKHPEDARLVPDHVVLKGANRPLPSFLELWKKYGENPNIKFNLIDNSMDIFKDSAAPPHVIINGSKVVDQEMLDKWQKRPYKKVGKGEGYTYEYEKPEKLSSLRDAEAEITARVSARLLHGEYKELGPDQTYRAAEPAAEEVTEEAQSSKLKAQKETTEETPTKEIGEEGATHGETGREDETRGPGDRGTLDRSPVGGPRAVADGERAGSNVEEVSGGPGGAEEANPPGGEEGGNLQPGTGERPGPRKRPGRGAGATGGRPKRRAGAEPGSTGTAGGRAEGEAAGVGAEPAETEARRNHRIEKEDVITPPGDEAKIQANIKAIRLVKELAQDNRKATPEEKKLLAQYVGWGAFSQKVFNRDFNTYLTKHAKDESPEQYWRYDPETLKKYKAWLAKYGKHLHPAAGGMLTEDEWTRAETSTLNAHWTSGEIIQPLWNLAEQLGFKGGTVVEPSAGVGHFFGFMPEGIAGKSDLIGVELDSLTGQILQTLYPAATIQVTGFEKARGLGNNSADLVISNFPFGNYPVYDPQHPDYSNWNIHNYFFARSIDVARPGGLVIAITSHYTMDAKDGKVREYLGNKADLVGAIRLPNTAFLKNAGTEVTTDILIFRKKAGDDFRGADFRILKDVEADKGQKVSVNEYFVDHPEMVLGTHSLKGTMHRAEGEYTLMPKAGQDLGQAIAAVIREHLPRDIAGPGVRIAPETKIARLEDKEGTILEQAGTIYQVKDGRLVEPTMRNSKGATVQALNSENRKKRAAAYLKLREFTRRLHRDAQDKATTDAEYAELQKELNRLYDAFVAQYGQLGSLGNAFLRKIDNDFAVVDGLEMEHQTTTQVERNGRKINQRHVTFTKADIFSRRTIFPWEEPKTAENLKDAVTVSLVYRGRIDEQYISEMLGLDVEATRKEILEKEQGYLNPETGMIDTPDQYLSGNVRKKLDATRNQVKEKPELERNIKALEAIQPKGLDIEFVSFRLGTSWIPESAIEQFIKDTFGVSAQIVRTESDEMITWVVAVKAGQDNARNTRQWATERRNGDELVEDSLNLRRTKVYDAVRQSDGSTKQVYNPDESLAAQEKQKEIQAKFREWVLEDKDRAETFTTAYNERANNWRLREFPAPEIDRFPGASTVMTLRPPQKKAVMRAVQESCLLAYGVGTGKTAIFITAAMEMRRLKTANKTMIVVQGATVGQYRKNFSVWYPQARVLIPDDKQRSARERKKLLSQIATGDWDAVVIPQSFFDGIADNPAREIAMVREQLDMMEETIDTMEAQEGSNSPTVKQMQAMKRRKEAHLEKLLNRRKDDALTFEELGIDALLIDEAHAYKRSDFFTKMGSVKGIDQGSSQRSLGLLLKANYVRQKTGGKNVILATGTPISNTIAELWTILRYVRPDLLAEYGVTLFDNFAANFGDTRIALEETAAGTFKQVERFNTYVNGPELLTMFRAGADVVLTRDADLQLPDVKGGKPTKVTIERSKPLAGFLEAVRDHYEWWEGLTGREKMQLRHVPLMLYGLAKKAAVDLRLVNPVTFSFDPNGKIAKVVENVERIWKETGESKSSQVVFLDRFRDASQKFNAHRDIKERLVQKGVPEQEIAIVEDANTDAARAAMFARVREGQVRVIIGSTQKLGVGVNIQAKLVAAHHVDVPDRPMDMEQRNGRIVRQKNENVEVEVYNYGVKQTLDSVGYDRMAKKQRFIDQVLTGDIEGRSFDDPLSEDQINYAEMNAAFAGDPALFEKTEVDVAIKQLRILREAHERRVSQARIAVRDLENHAIPNAKKELEKARSEAKLANSTLNDEGHIKEFTYQGKPIERKELAGLLQEKIDEADKVGQSLNGKSRTEIIEATKDKTWETKVKIGPMIVDVTVHPSFSQVLKEGTADIEEYYAIKKTMILRESEHYKDIAHRSFETAAGFATALENQIKELQKEPEHIEKFIAKKELELKETQKVAGEKWGQGEELKAKEGRLAEIEEYLRQKTRQAQAEDKDEQAEALVAGLMHGGGHVEEAGAKPQLKKGEKLYYKNSREAGFTQVAGKPVEIVDWLDTFITHEGKEWTIREVRSGFNLGPALESREDAIRAARERAESLGEEKVKASIEEAVQEYGEAPKVEGEETLKKEGGEEQYAFGEEAEPGAVAAKVSLEDAQRIFKGQAVERTPEGDIKVLVGAGRSVIIKAVDQIDPDRARLKISYGRDLAAGEVIAGKYKDGVIELQRTAGDRWILLHESVHFMEDAGIISPSDVGILKAKIRSLEKKGQWKPQNPKDVGGAEDRAAWVSEQLSGLYDTKTLTGKILAKMQQFIDRAMEVLGIRTAAGVVREIESGEIFEEKGQRTKDKGEDLVKEDEWYAVAQVPNGAQVAADIEKNRSFANRIFELRDQAKVSIDNQVAGFQREVQRMAGAPSKRKFVLGFAHRKDLKRSMASDRLDRAMMIYRDLQSAPAKAQEFRTWATAKLAATDTKASEKLTIKENLQVLDQAENLTQEQKDFAMNTVGDAFERAYGVAERAKVIQTHRDNYVRRLWNLPEGKEEYRGGSGHGFTVYTTAAKKRTLPTILDGWMAGYELRVKGLTNSYGHYVTEVATILANKAFIQRGVKTHDTNGNAMFSTNQRTGYKPLQANGFQVWRWVGDASAEADLPDEEALAISTYGRKFFATAPVRIPEKWAVYPSDTATKAVRLFDREQDAKDFADQGGFTRIEHRPAKDVSTLFEKQPLYAPAPLADMINRMTAKDTLFNATPGLNVLLRLNAGVKSWILMSSFFHHMAGTRSWVFAVHHGWKGVNPVAAYKKGLQKIEDLHPLISLGVKNGLTLGDIQDWSEQELRENKGLTERLVRYLGLEKTAKVIEYGKFRREQWADSLFKKFFAGLKAEAFVIEYAHDLQKATEKYAAGRSAEAPDSDKIAEKVARLINDDFGGLHLERMGRNPTLQKMARMLLLAPDWTESNFRTVTGMIPGLNEWISKAITDVAPPKGMDQLYRRFWGRAMLRIAVMTAIAQLLLNGSDETEEWLTEQALSNQWTRYRWTELEITRLYEMLGIDTEEQGKTFSIGGHFFDPLKLIDPWTLIKHKGSPFVRLAESLFTGSDWSARPYTGAGELLRTGKTIKKSRYERTAGAYDRLPSTLVNQVLGMQPIQVGQFIRYLQGEDDGLTALLRAAGAATHTAYPPFVETPIVYSDKGGAVKEEIGRLTNAGALHMGPPNRTVTMRGVTEKMSRAQYDQYVSESSALAEKKLITLVESEPWQNMTPEKQTQYIEAIIKNARRKARSKVKRVIAKEHRAESIEQRAEG